jgi:hypothetical protein
VPLVGVRTGEKEYNRDWGEWGIVCGGKWEDGGEFEWLGWRGESGSRVAAHQIGRSTDRPLHGLDSGEPAKRRFLQKLEKSKKESSGAGAGYGAV